MTSARSSGRTPEWDVVDVNPINIAVMIRHRRWKDRGSLVIWMTE